MHVNMNNLRRYTWTIAAVAIAIVAMGILLASRRTAPEAEEMMAADMAPSTEAVVTEAPKKAAPKKAQTRKVNTSVGTSSKPAKPAANTAKPAASAAAKPATTAVAKPASSEDKAATTGLETVSITGCLERDDDVYRLKDTEGANVPKARSWKSGFLKKGGSKVEVVDASNRLKLQNHVGRRVSVTGTLYEREMVANSVRRVADSCDR
jgi:hypothetical protein